MNRNVAFLALAACVAGIALAGPDEERLAAAMKSPPATGILVTQVVPGSQAEEQGLRVGDVLVSYGGRPTPDLAALNAAKEACAEQEEIEAAAVGAEGEKKLALRAGQIGFNGLPVVKGEPVPPLPADSGVALDFSVLEGGPLESWKAFSLDGKTQAGFEHSVLRLDGGKVLLTSEVAFDGGEQWGLNHFVVTVVMEPTPKPLFQSTSFRNPLSDWVGTCTRSLDGKSFRVRWPEEESRTEALPGDLPAVPSYFVEALAGLMPREEGACVQFRVLNEGMGNVGLPAALVCVGEEEIDLDGAGTKAWRYEWRQLGGAVSAAYWYGDTGPSLRADWQGAVGTRATKEQALEGLHPDLHPETTRLFVSEENGRSCASDTWAKPTVFL